MAKEQRRELAEVVEFLKSWNGYNLNALEYELMLLEDFDQSADQDYWEEIKNILRENAHFDADNERIVHLFKHKITEAHWWYNPETWKK